MLNILLFNGYDAPQIEGTTYFYCIQYNTYMKLDKINY